MECSICLDKIKKYKTTTKCGHHFHRQCLQKWSSNCPICRTKIVGGYCIPKSKKGFKSSKKVLKELAKIIDVKKYKDCKAFKMPKGYTNLPKNQDILIEWISETIETEIDGSPEEKIASAIRAIH